MNVLCQLQIQASLKIKKIKEMSHGVAFPTRLHMQPANTQINLHVHAVITLQGNLWVAKNPSVFSWTAKTDQTVQLHRHIWVFPWSTCYLEGNAVPQLIYQ